LFCVLLVVSTKFTDAEVYGVCLRPALLLQFMEYLERHLYNAIEGCAVAMAPLPKVLVFCFTALLTPVQTEIMMSGLLGCGRGIDANVHDCLGSFIKQRNTDGAAVLC